MLPKEPKSKLFKRIKSGVIGLLLFEGFAFVASYGVYHRMNTSREFRAYMNENFPLILDCYYKLGETLDNNNIRQIDAAVWKATQQKSDK